VHDSVENLDTRLAGERFDVIALHWVLHHFVLDTYSATRDLQRRVLASIGSHLTERGRVSVFENLYEGRLVDGLTGRLVFELTASPRLARVVRYLGANTAGCGVCFLSERQWRRSFSDSGLELHRAKRYAPLGVSRLYQTALLARSIERCHFWLARAVVPASGTIQD
jgi:hypothetical protein